MIEDCATPLAYATRIAAYISDPSTIRARTMDQFGRAPSLQRCAELRAEVERERNRQTEILKRKSMDHRELYEGITAFACGHSRGDDNVIFDGSRTLCRTCEEARLVAVAKLEDIRAKVLAAPPPPPPVIISAARRALLAIAAAERLDPDALRGRSRKYTHTVPRFAVWLVMREAGWAYARIAEYFGADHSSVMHGIRRAEGLMADDERYAALVQRGRDAWREGPPKVPEALVAALVRQ